ncbi:MAG: leucine dehydrogenase [Candidatus Aenigmatarchaeota archaeon]|nr:amino acid dehydrogenase [Deltaproteobacteria bacterium]RLJ04925.1 MAG: leucine dehydrogenase [Candidatus Aenigmarchaeota archaeon]HDH86476.1 amino acid dehydrogenase [Desulfobacteraceae bacterium]
MSMLFEKLENYGCEEAAFFCDKESGLKAIIVIHDTTLGPAFGGTRLWSYHDEEEALIDVLRLARGMSRKSSISDLDAGGGKAVIMAKPEQKTEALLRAHGRFVETFKGRFITGEDLGIGIEDAKIMRKETAHVAGISKEVGDPSPFTANGVVCGMRACARDVYGSSNLSGLRVAIQGVGHVGYNLAKDLHKEGSELIVADIREELTKRVSQEFGAMVVTLEEIYSVDCDIFAPCALGAIINDETIPKLKCKIVAGSANNQLEENRHGRILHEKGIRYAPDYVINSGGLIAVYMEIKQGSMDEIMKKVEQIEGKIERIISLSKEHNEPTHEIANRLADERISAKKKELERSKKA